MTSPTPSPKPHWLKRLHASAHHGRPQQNCGQCLVAERERASELFLSHTAPYGRQEIRDGRLVITCPACDQEFTEITDSRTGELISDRYGDHYQEAHRDH